MRARQRLQRLERLRPPDSPTLCYNKRGNHDGTERAMTTMGF
jgi:hypothetical protein